MALINAVPGLTSIIILTFNKSEYTKRCLDTIYRHTHEPFEIVIIDNGSRDDTLEYLRALGKDNMRLIANQQNRGFPAGCNQGAVEAHGEYLVFLNNDTAVAPGWLSGLIDNLKKDPLAGIVGPMTNFASNAQLIPEPEKRAFERFDEIAMEQSRAFKGQTIASRRLVGFCIAISRKVWDRCGPFDEGYGIGNFEDDDLCLSAETKGYHNIIAQDVYVHHFVGQGFACLSIEKEDLCRQNAHRFYRKWGNRYADWPGLKGFLVNVVNIAIPVSDDSLDKVLDIVAGLNKKPPFPNLISLVYDGRTPAVLASMAGLYASNAIYGYFYRAKGSVPSRVEMINCAWVNHAAKAYLYMPDSLVLQHDRVVEAIQKAIVSDDFGIIEISLPDRQATPLLLVGHALKHEVRFLDRRVAPLEKAIVDFAFRASKRGFPYCRLEITSDNRITEKRMAPQELEAAIPLFRKLYLKYVKFGKVRISRKSMIGPAWCRGL